MSYAALADSGKSVAHQYGHRERVKPEAATPVAAKPKALPPMTQKYVQLCAVILKEITRQGKTNRSEIPVNCTHHEFKCATGYLKDQIVYVGHAPAGGWRLR